MHMPCGSFQFQLGDTGRKLISTSHDHINVVVFRFSDHTGSTPHLAVAVTTQGQFYTYVPVQYFVVLHSVKMIY